MHLGMLGFNKNFLGKAAAAALVLFMLLIALVLFWPSSKTPSTTTGVDPQELEAEADTEAQIEARFEELATANPLIRQLPHLGNRFEVHYGTESDQSKEVYYVVVLRPKTYPSDGEIYVNEINSLTENSKNWIRQQGFDPQTLNIEWTIK